MHGTYGLGSLKSQCTVDGGQGEEAAGGGMGDSNNLIYTSQPAGGADIVLPPYYQVNAIAAIHHTII